MYDPSRKKKGESRKWLPYEESKRFLRLDCVILARTITSDNLEQQVSLGKQTFSWKFYHKFTQKKSQFGWLCRELILDRQLTGLQATLAFLEYTLLAHIFL